MNIPKAFDNALVRFVAWNLIIGIVANLIVDFNNPQMLPMYLVCALIIYSYYNLYSCKCK